MFPSLFTVRLIRHICWLTAVLLLAACADQTIMTSATIAAPAAQADLLVWARGNAQDHQRADALIAAIRREPALANVAARAEMYHIGAGSYTSLWEAASENGRPPDIVSLDMDDLAEWAQNGRIIPLDECLNSEPAFAHIRPALWTAVTWQEQRWGVPHELGLHLLFFNKTKLRQLGWSESDIEALPRRIQSGAFTQDDLTAVAAEAVQQGVVKPGFGFWPDPGEAAFLNYYAAAGGDLTGSTDVNKLVLSRRALTAAYAQARQLAAMSVSPDQTGNNTWNQSFGRSVRQDTVTHGQVLFWSAPAWSWVRWAQYYVNDLGGETYLAEQIGFAPHPARQAGQPGFAWAQVRLYAVSAGLDEAQQARACQVLAAVTRPAVNLAHVLDNFYLSPLTLEEDDPVNAAYLSHPTLQAMEEIAAVSHIPPMHVAYGRYLSTLSAALRQAESGELLPDAAATAAITELQDALGEALIVQP